MQAKKAEKAMRALFDEEMAVTRDHARDFYIDGQEPEETFRMLRSYEAYLSGIQHSAIAIGVSLNRSPLTIRIVKRWFNEWDKNQELAESRSATLKA